MKWFRHIFKSHSIWAFKVEHWYCTDILVCTCVLYTVLDGCFVESGNNCGNGIVDDGEQCDCGGSNNFDTDGICNNDPCCNGMMCNRTVGPGIECRYV